MEDIDTTVLDVSRALLSCGHEYHPKCILEWFKKSDTCPTCREPHIKRENAESTDEVVSRESIASLINTIDQQVLSTQLNLENITRDTLQTGRLISSRVHLSDITNSHANFFMNDFFNNNS